MAEPFIPYGLAWLAPFVGAGAIAIAMLLGIRSERFYGYVSVLSILISAVVSAQALREVLGAGKPIHVGNDILWIPWLNVTLGTYFDGLSSVMAVVVSWISLLIAIYSVKYMEGDWGYGRYFLFFTFFVGSMMLLVLADNLILLFIGWEGTGLASYALIGHWYTDEEDKGVGRPGRYALGFPMFFEPSHSSLRAILFTRVGDIALLVGIAVIYFAAGTFNIIEIAEKTSVWMGDLSSRGILSLTLAILSLGMLAKSAQFPFHEWLVTAMTGPTPVSALIHAATMVKAGIYLFLRLVPVVLAGAAALGLTGEIYSYFLFMALIGAVTAFLLATMAIASDELKLILAYSTASQIGYMFLGAASAGLLVYGIGPEAVAESVLAGLSHLASHAVFKASLFLIAGWLIHSAHSRFIDDMGEMAKYMKLTAAALWLAGLSLVGIPPLVGFFSKEAIIHVALASPLLAALAMATVALTAAYTTRMILRVMHMPSSSHRAEHHEAPPIMLIPYAVLAIASLLLGVAWPYFADILAEASRLTLSLGVPYRLEISLSGTTIAAVSVAVASMVAVFASYRSLGGLLATLKSSPLFELLYNRWYINSIIYAVFKNGGARVRDFMVNIDLGIDGIYHQLVPMGGSVAANALRSLHRGATDYYMALYIASFIIAMLLVLILMG